MRRCRQVLTMVKIEIYTTLLCPYCHAAKRLLVQKGLEFTEVDVTLNYPKRARMAERAGGRRSVPQIFIDGVSIGGCDELHALERAGELDPLIAV